MRVSANDSSVWLRILWDLEPAVKVRPVPYPYSLDLRSAAVRFLPCIAKAALRARSLRCSGVIASAAATQRPR